MSMGLCVHGVYYEIVLSTVLFLGSDLAVTSPHNPAPTFYPLFLPLALQDLLPAVCTVTRSLVLFFSSLSFITTLPCCHSALQFPQLTEGSEVKKGRGEKF